MDFSALILGIKEWTPSTITTVAIFVLSYILRTMKKQNEIDAAQNAAFKKDLAEGLTAMESKISREISDIKDEQKEQRAEQKEQRREIQRLKESKVERRELKEDISAIRSQLIHLEEVIMTNQADLSDKVIELWKRKE